MELRGATATHVGNVRENNQDRGHFGGYVAVVADGMGGHQGGETAATIAISEFVAITTPIGPSGLVELVEEANRAVFERAADPDLRGMGTTLVALTLRPQEAKVSVVNVGDSRAYYLRGNELGRLTNDHSLVEDLVRQKRLTPDEALNHPQRNILTRALGISSHVEVDQFLVPTKVGDRFLLCSDGLFNEVSEDEIMLLLQEHEAPDAAAHALVSAALRGAGRDNITVVVADVVEDGRGASLAPSSQPDTILAPAVTTGPIPLPDGGRAQPTPSGGGVIVQESPPAATPFDPEHTSFHAAPEPVTAPLTTPGAVTLQVQSEPVAAGYETFEPEPSRGRRALSLIGVGVVIGALVAAGFLAARWFNQRTWFVATTNGGQVAVFNGRPGGLLWVDPVQTSESDLRLEELVADDQAMVATRPTFSSEGEAERFVDGLKAEVAMIEDAAEPLDEISSTTTTTAATTTTPAVTTPATATPASTNPASTAQGG